MLNAIARDSSVEPKGPQLPVWNSVGNREIVCVRAHAVRALGGKGRAPRSCRSNAVREDNDRWVEELHLGAKQAGRVMADHLVARVPDRAAAFVIAAEEIRVDQAISAAMPPSVAHEVPEGQSAVLGGLRKTSARERLVLGHGAVDIRRERAERLPLLQNVPSGRLCAHDHDAMARPV